MWGSACIITVGFCCINTDGMSSNCLNVSWHVCTQCILHHPWSYKDSYIIGFIHPQMNEINLRDCLHGTFMEDFGQLF